MGITPGKIAIVGTGPGSAQYVTEAARTTAARADTLVGSQRLLALFPDGPAERILVGSDIPALLLQVAALHAAGRKIAILVGGDPGLCSLAQNVIRHFGREHCEVVPAVSSVQVAFARVGLDWGDARIVSAHGRTPDVGAGELGGTDKIAILAGTQDALRWSARLADALGATHVAFLAENLTLDDERCREFSAEQLGTVDAASLSIVLLIRRSLLT